MRVDRGREVERGIKGMKGGDTGREAIRGTHGRGKRL